MLPPLGRDDGPACPYQQRCQLPPLLHHVTPIQGYLPLPPLPTAPCQSLSKDARGDRINATLEKPLDIYYVCGCVHPRHFKEFFLSNNSSPTNEMNDKGNKRKTVPHENFLTLLREEREQRRGTATISWLSVVY